jgi:hypothetical protein
MFRNRVVSSLNTRPIGGASLKPALAVFALAGIALAAAPAAHASGPVLGARLYAKEDRVWVQVLPTDASYTSELWRVSPGPLTYITTSKNYGHLVAVPTLPGHEVIFLIRVRETGRLYFTGPNYRNPDGIPHAAMDWIGPWGGILGFEDLFGGGDHSYNDAFFALRGVREHP